MDDFLITFPYWIQVVVFCFCTLCVDLMSAEWVQMCEWKFVSVSMTRVVKRWSSHYSFIGLNSSWSLLQFTSDTLADFSLINWYFRTNKVHNGYVKKKKRKKMNKRCRGVPLKGSSLITLVRCNFKGTSIKVPKVNDHSCTYKRTFTFVWLYLASLYFTLFFWQSKLLLC